MTTLSQVTQYLEKHAPSYEEPTRIVAEKVMGWEYNEGEDSFPDCFPPAWIDPIADIVKGNAIYCSNFNPFTSLDDCKIVVDKLDVDQQKKWAVWVNWITAKGLFEIANATSLSRMTALFMALGLPTETKE